MKIWSIFSSILLTYVIAFGQQPQLRLEPFATVSAQETPAQNGGLMPASDRNGNQYLCQNTNIVALSAEGRIKWTYPIPPLQSCDILDEGVVFVSTVDHFVVALSSSGEVLWKYSGQGRAGVASIIGLSASDALAVIDMSAYEFSGPDKVVRFKNGQRLEGELNVRAGSRLYRDKLGRPFLLTPLSEGKIQIFRISTEAQ